jgi:predicted metal-dependent hydrolase
MKSLLFQRYKNEIHDDLDALDMPDPRVIANRSPRAKRMALRVDNALGQIKLVIPSHTSLKNVQSFVNSQSDWIEEQLSKLMSGIPFDHGTQIPIFGTLYRIDIRCDNAFKRTRIQLKDKKILILTNQEDPSLRLERFLKKRAKEILTTLSEDKARIIGKDISSVSVKDTKSRWGSCTASGALSYSWRLIFAPYEAIDYVTAHEVAHLQHLDHSKAFWALCAKLSDDYVEGKYWMQNHGSELMRYGRD